MLNNFDSCLAFVLRDDIEGGNDDDPQDSGGRTSRGITQREYNAYCRLHGSTAGDVWKAPADTIKAIYYHGYWQPYGDLIPKGLDLMFFDTAVNEGMGKSVTFLQHALGINADGHFGMVTADAVQHISNVSNVLGSMAEQRRAHYHSLGKFKRFGKGWLARVDKCMAAAKVMVGS